MRVAVLGAGAWGSALAAVLAKRHPTTLWCRDPAQARAMAAARENVRYLPGCPLPDPLHIRANLADALAGADLALCVVPSSALRATLSAAQGLGFRGGLVWACKGFEPATSMLPHEVATACGVPAERSGVVSGPSFAREVALGLPAALTVAGADADFAASTARVLHGGRLRVYSSVDVIGVELGGALKNVMAIAAGMCDGMELGDNARAALVTRGLAEIVRLGTRLGGRPATFNGLTGLGDLVLTCTGGLSRNRQVGLKLAAGEPLAAILAGLGHVAEGVVTAAEARRLARDAGVEMPITEAVCAVLEGAVSPAQAVQALLSRDPKPE
jgi:glycerol-3-phosphate dehydrogenase (NAD(P)+)